MENVILRVGAIGVVLVVLAIYGLFETATLLTVKESRAAFKAWLKNRQEKLNLDYVFALILQGILVTGYSLLTLAVCAWLFLA